MQTGFEVTAATPKRLRAAEDAPVAETMRGERRITQAPSTDQKKVRRQMQRKTADLEYIASMHRIASMPLEAYLASLGPEATEIEIEAGVRDWWRARRTAFEPLKNSGIPGHPSAPCLNCGGHGIEPGNAMAACRQCAGTGSQASEHTPVVPGASGCASCSGTGKGFYGESCPRCAGTGRPNSRHPNFAIPADQSPQAPTAQPSRTVLPASSYGRTAAMNDVGECRLCGGDLIPHRQDGETTHAACEDCGTKHELQGGAQKSAAQKFEIFSNLDQVQVDRLKVLAWWRENGRDCPHCGSTGMRADGFADGGDDGFRMALRCEKCHYSHLVPTQHPTEDDDTFSAREKKHRQKHNPESHGTTASARLATLISLVGSTWVPVYDTSPYLGQTGMSAIARRAQSVLDTEESS